ncbi:xylulokinase [Deminuibacter soli]|uniref:Carbohydrate kinase n=1 Tax=Deminuibacter soli TaxID=2291815 RepID=A0A3E1NEE2_9BACT|nr:FGGY family carbohydrate kinase [Deminuibacter soli]RFM26355.1 carbohydrate kinase [Deminuibacter soli]
MLLLGIDLGTSSIKVSVVDAATQQCIAAAQYPDYETPVIVAEHGWAEQSPDTWWEHVQQAILKAHATKKYNPHDIAAIGIAYQMHGLVIVNKQQQVLRNAIIWCDSRAVTYGNAAFDALGADYCLPHLLNSPGNFTAAKLAWVKANEPAVYDQVAQLMLPGDFIALRLTGAATTSASALSEGIFWDFTTNSVSGELMQYFGFSNSMIPVQKNVFAEHGLLSADVAATLQLKPGIPVAYKAGDQPNNALSLNVLQPGEVAATAGTSGVIYGVSDALTYDPLSRVNTFAHVNHTAQAQRLGVLLCINGTGILNRWVRDNWKTSYTEMNEQAAAIPAGSNGLLVMPFGNGAERMLENRLPGAQFNNIDLNTHTPAHIFRAAQEGIAFAFRYGLDIMRASGMNPSVIRAGKANMFLSSVFTEAFVNATNVPVELYNSDGSVGAALGAGIGAGIFASEKEAFAMAQPLALIEPNAQEVYGDLYNSWKSLLEKQL